MFVPTANLLGFLLRFRKISLQLSKDNPALTSFADGLRGTPIQRSLSNSEPYKTVATEANPALVNTDNAKLLPKQIKHKNRVLILECINFIQETNGTNYY